MTDLNDLLLEQLRVMYGGETHLIKALIVLRANTSDQALADILDNYQDICEDQILRLKRVFNMLYAQKRGEECEAMKAMIRESWKIMDRSTDVDIRDAGIITSLQHIIHYKIAGYGAICNYANTLVMYHVADILHQNLEEEKQVDRKLIDLAEQRINLRATPVSRHQ